MKRLFYISLLIAFVLLIVIGNGGFVKGQDEEDKESPSSSSGEPASAEEASATSTGYPSISESPSPSPKTKEFSSASNVYVDGSLWAIIGIATFVVNWI
ncbi:hypothetical protein F8M41_018216 [Gigaspora margarita]|uniref:Transmembrane protein n=1 Tax=Gigaspora margarita TaxID=4874 RepID=A0A8H4ALT0_GIGMA|nr:hypothetical protein F8M41_018216 [Gigaspora margarita]